jgi:hypothetical protein
MLKTLIIATVLLPRLAIAQRNGDAFRRYAPQFFAILHPVTGKEGR